MTTTRRSSGAHGPWNMADTSVRMDGRYDGPGASVTGRVTLAGLGAVPGDVVNVGEVANRIATGPVLSGVKYRNAHRP